MSEDLPEVPVQGRPDGQPFGRWAFVRLAASNLLAFAGAVLAMIPLLGRRRPVASAGARTPVPETPAQRDTPDRARGA
jgi:hypothetical protein